MESADLGLGIKVFFPTKVVAGQPMTINGSGFSDVTEIEFPGGVKAAGFELVSNEMIRVVAPAGIAAEGGVLKVRNKDGEVVESRVPLTLGKTAISGFSKQDGEKIGGGEQLVSFAVRRLDRQADRSRVRRSFRKGGGSGEREELDDKHEGKQDDTDFR